MQMQVEQVMEAMETIRCGASCTEAALHELVAAALASAGFDVQHEVRLVPRCRIDFLVGDIGIEIKKQRPDRTRLVEQLARYAQCDIIGQLLVVAPRGVSLPRYIAGKRVTMMALERLWGISLP